MTSASTPKLTADGDSLSPGQFLLTALIAVAVVAGVYGLTAHLHLDLFDEGFLWYGVIRTAAGEIPGLDFQAYDPGRYYWGAAWSRLLGEGILALRLSCAIFQTLGLLAGLLVLRRVVSHPAGLVTIAVVLCVWMFPRNKVFESSLASMAVLVLVRLLERPATGRCLQAGAFVGLAAFFGRNHGLYCGVGFLGVLLLLQFKSSGGDLLARMRAGAIGVLIGYSPMLLMLALAPGFADRFVESLLSLGARGTNLPLPVPWPWKLPFGSMPTGQLASELAVGSTYLALALAYPIGLLWALRTRTVDGRVRPVLIACLAIGIPYAHHASVRSDATHLAEAIQPFLLGCFAAPFALGVGRRRVAAGLIWAWLGICTATVAWGVHPHLMAFGRNAGVPLESVKIAGDAIEVPADQAPVLTGIKRSVKQIVPEGEPLFIAPFRVSYYPLLRRVAPLWDIYMLWAAPDDYQQEMIRQLDTQGVNWALIITEALAEDPDTAFARTHPLVQAHLAREFELVRSPMIPIGHLLLRRRSR